MKLCCCETLDSSLTASITWRVLLHMAPIIGRVHIGYYPAIEWLEFRSSLGSGRYTQDAFKCTCLRGRRPKD